MPAATPIFSVPDLEQRGAAPNVPPGPGAPLHQDGDAFGVPYVAGSTDAEDVEIIAGATVLVRIKPTGQIDFGRQSGGAASTMRPGQISYSIGQFSAPGDNQGWALQGHGATPGAGGPDESLLFSVQLEDGKAYRVTWDAIASAAGAAPGTPDIGWWNPSGGAPPALNY